MRGAHHIRDGIDAVEDEQSPVCSLHLGLGEEGFETGGIGPVVVEDPSLGIVWDRVQLVRSDGRDRARWRELCEELG